MVNKSEWKRRLILLKKNAVIIKSLTSMTKSKYKLMGLITISVWFLRILLFREIFIHIIFLMLRLNFWNVKTLLNLKNVKIKKSLTIILIQKNSLLLLLIHILISKITINKSSFSLMIHCFGKLNQQDQRKLTSIFRSQKLS